MLMRALGRTGMKVAALCLGGNTFGWTTDQKASETVLDAYVEAGGNFIDTADVYSRWAPGNTGGESETALGIWMAARRNRPAVIMATKVCGPMGPGPNDKGLSRLHIMRAVEASLRRLQTDYIDLYQAHWDDRDTPLEETLRAFDDLVRQSRSASIGASNHVAWRLTRTLWEARATATCHECLHPSTTLSSATVRAGSACASSGAWASSVLTRSAAASRASPRAADLPGDGAHARRAKTYVTERGCRDGRRGRWPRAPGRPRPRSRFPGSRTGRASRRRSPARPRSSSSRSSWAASSSGWTRARGRRWIRPAPGARADRARAEIRRTRVARAVSGWSSRRVGPVARELRRPSR